MLECSENVCVKFGLYISSDIDFNLGMEKIVFK